MQDHADRNDFAPPPQPAAAQAFVLAIIAHLLLLAALTWGINWKREAEKVSAEAELWSSLPQAAAPRAAQAPQPPTPPVATPPPPPPPPQVAAPPPPPAPAPVPKQPDIALEREKKKQELAERRRQEVEQQRKLEARKKEEDLERQERDRKLEARKKLEEQKRQQVAQQKADEDKKRKAEEQAKAKAQQDKAKQDKAKQDDARLAALRKENMDRMMKGATGSGDPRSTGTAARASGPSASYAGRIAARIKPNIVFTDNLSGNPAAVVEIRVAPDGTIVGRKLLESSGVKAWDDAVVRAVDRTEVLPRDTDGTVVPQFSIRFRPRD